MNHINHESIKEKSHKQHVPASKPYNHEMLDEALTGLLAGLEKHSGILRDVTEMDILSSSAIHPDAFRYYYRTADGVMRDVYREIGHLLAGVEKTIKHCEMRKTLYSLFESLGRQPVMLQIILLIDDTSVWSRSMWKIVRNIAVDWPDQHGAWEYLYFQFIGQFHSILKKWGTANFSKAHITECVDLAELWLLADKLLGKSGEALVSDWT